MKKVLIPTPKTCDKGPDKWAIELVKVNKKIKYYDLTLFNLFRRDIRNIHLYKIDLFSFFSLLVSRVLNKKVIFTLHGDYIREGRSKGKLKRLFWNLGYHLFISLSDVVTFPSNFLLRKYKKKSNFSKKELFVIYNPFPFNSFKNRDFSKERWIVNNSDYVTVVSNAIKEEFVRLGIKDKTKLKVIPMGVDTTLFNQNKYDESIKKKYDIKPFLLFVGRLSEKKGVKYLIAAMPKIVEEFPKAKLLIIGDGEDKKELISQAKMAGLLDKNIIFTGAIYNTKLPSFYATADIFIGPSIIAKSGDREGFGLVFAEAMASGCVTVASDLAAVKDIIVEGENGFLVEQKNPNDITKKVIYLLQNKTKMKNIKSKGVKYISGNFDWNVICKKYGDLID